MTRLVGSRGFPLRYAAAANSQARGWFCAPAMTVLQYAFSHLKAQYLVVFLRGCLIVTVRYRKVVIGLMLSCIEQTSSMETISSKRDGIAQKDGGNVHKLAANIFRDSLAQHINPGATRCSTS